MKSIPEEGKARQGKEADQAEGEFEQQLISREPSDVLIGSSNCHMLEWGDWLFICSVIGCKIPDKGE